MIYKGLWLDVKRDVSGKPIVPIFQRRVLGNCGKYLKFTIVV